MAGSDDDEEKQHDPSQKKLDDARKKGEVPRSNDLGGAISYATFLLALVILGDWIINRWGELGVAIFEMGAAFGQPEMSNGVWLRNGLFTSYGATLAPLLAAPGIAVLISLIAQRSLVFAPSKLKPKLSRISPLSNAKNKFGRSGLFEFAKSFTKLVIISGILAVFLITRTDRIMGMMSLTPGAVAQGLGHIAIEFLSILVVLFGAIGAIDLLWQHAEHRRRNRMSHKELKDEHKEAEGDPHMKQLRRQRGQEIALSTMLGDVARANVVIVNPQHYAVALEWDASFGGPPVCVAKGIDEIAARIREAAQRDGVPIHRDPPTARALFAVTDVGAEISPDEYRPVAAAIRFADRMRQLAQRRILE